MRSRLALGALLSWSFTLRVWCACAGLDSGRYWDERYAIRNLQAVVVDGSLRPVSYYYQSLSYLPQAALLAAVEWGAHRTGHEEYSFFSGGRLLPEGYLLCRLTVVVFSLLSLWLTFRLGRRIFDAEVGLAAALLLAATPLHIRLSTFFKPDMLVLALTLVTLWWSLDALETSRWRCYLLAGLGVGLAMSAKLTGGLAAIPLTAGALVEGWRDRRHWVRLCGAGIMAAAVFVILNPQLDLYLGAFLRNLHLYEHRSQLAEEPREGHWSALAGIVGFLLSPQGHHSLLGGCALIGLAALLGLAFSRGRQRRDLLLLVSYPVGFALIYAAVTPYPKANNFLPVLAFSALAAGWLLVSAWRAAGTRMAVFRWRVSGAVAGIGCAAAVIYPAHVFSYVLMVPSIWQSALRDTAAGLDPSAGRVVLFEDPPGRLQARNDAERSARWPVRALGVIPTRRLALSDAEVFRLSRLEGESGAFYRERLRSAGAQVRVVQPRLFQTRGEPLVLLLHAARLVSVTEVDTGSARSVGLPLPPLLGCDESISAEIRTPFRKHRELLAPTLRLDGRLLPLHFAYRHRRFVVWMSDRLRLSMSRHLELRLPGRHRMQVRLYRWSHVTLSPVACFQSARAWSGQP